MRGGPGVVGGACEEEEEVVEEEEEEEEEEVARGEEATPLKRVKRQRKFTSSQ